MRDFRLTSAFLLLSFLLPIFATAATSEESHYAVSEPSEQMITITGRVLDEEGLPLPGVTIIIKGNPTQGATTDSSGRFSIMVPKEGETVLVFSYIGMKHTEIRVSKKRTSLEVSLHPDVELLDEVVVTGYQTISKERATGSFAVIKPGDLSEKLQTSILGRLEGKVAGLTSGPEGLTLRGVSTLRGNTTPLIVLDGVPYTGSLSSINPSTIANVTVLKDAAAASIYGARAANGVIVVTTKRGESGHIRVSYDGSVTLAEKPRYGALNRMNSAELVDHMVDWIYKLPNSGVAPEDYPYYQDPVLAAISRERNGLMTKEELTQELEKYRSFDNEEQLAARYLRTGLVHQHNVSVSGGSERNTFLLSLNYLGNHPTTPFGSSRSYGISLSDRFDLTSWIHLDATLSASLSDDISDVGVGSYGLLRQSYPSYTRFFDKEGKPLYVPDSEMRSEAELKRLIDLGTYDMHYNPYLNKGHEISEGSDQFYRLNLGVTINLPASLKLSLRYAGERSNGTSRTVMDKESHTARQDVIGGATIDPRSGKVIYNVPEGGQLFRTIGTGVAYTLRSQLSYILDSDRHYVTALSGIEIRDLHDKTVRSHYFGYDDNSLAYVPVDPKKLASLRGTLSSSGFYKYDYAAQNNMQDRQDRFFSFYANASYSYDRRYDLTGSIRIDQSNLFGTDPKYQYRPLWSLGAGWHLSEETFAEEARDWLSRLVLRATYGIGGNIPKTAGPYLTFSAPVYDLMARDFVSDIPTPPNPALRWERTATTNVGLDFALFGDKLRGSIEWYHKYTDDLLAERQSDPTLGWDKLLLNYGSMQNNGLEVMLSSELRLGEVSWAPTLVLGINHNKLLNVQESNPNTFHYTRGNTAAVGYPLHSVFSFPSKGLDHETGQPIYLRRDPASGTLVETKKATDLTLDDLVYSGTTVPTYNGSLTNTFSYKGITLSMMVMYGGGNVFRAVAPANNGYGVTTNSPCEYLLRWQKPGDESVPGMNPPITGTSPDDITAHAWPASDKQIVRGDYLRLSDISLSYSLPSSWAGALGAQDVRLTMQLRNLLTLGLNSRGYDPLSMTTTGYGWGTRSLPMQRTIALGASVNF
ncbi:SusC/RagA family TonB-linked outer membrane protein [uncultured Porphyromonas sp.]|uniref:SusC/RagA family TonB-linked outer membrane protein n=1 Tax=uncultured Porphyromonas sp. TaxID=159274 RepID=UPI002626DD8F|nr:SusC/RagA family TonB-linked outer membrane protein [uncultured Porphyromonas sp.]